MILQHKRLLLILLSVPVLLLIPFIAMQFTGEVNWSPADFAVMGILLASAGLACEFLLRRVKQTKHRVALVLVVLVVFLLVWAELAVGVFGTP